MLILMLEMIYIPNWVKQNCYPEYEDKISPEKVYHVLVLAKGIYLGGGYDLNKKLAAQKAAMCALANKVKLSELDCTHKV